LLPPKIEAAMSFSSVLVISTALLPNSEFGAGQVPQGMPITAAGLSAGACRVNSTALFRFIERAVEGPTWLGYFAAQNHPRFVQAMAWRVVFEVMTIAGGGLLFWDLLTIGKKETRPAAVIRQPA
jgi:hypothetical protein